MFRIIKKIVAMELAELIYMTRQYSEAMGEEEPKKPAFGFVPDRSIIEMDVEANADRGCS